MFSYKSLIQLLDVNPFSETTSSSELIESYSKVFKMFMTSYLHHAFNGRSDDNFLLFGFL